MKKIIVFILFLATSFFYSSAYSQQVAPKAEFLMSMDLKLATPAGVDPGLLIVEIPSGTISGPNIKGTVHPPSADWVQILPSGVMRLDVRLLVKTDDGDTIYVSYNGVLKMSEEASAKFNKGEEVTPNDGWYFFAAPTFRTSSKKYDYLNSIQAINKYMAVRLGPDGGYVKVDVFALK